MPEATLTESPAWIVVLGGGGIPSESGLIRTYYGARAAHKFPDAGIIVALPGDVTVADDSLTLMRAELILRGVDPARIRVEPIGTNTRSQAVEIRRMLGDNALGRPLMIVTSPDHMRRSVLSFRRVGFEQVGADAAMPRSVQSDLLIDDELVDGSLAVPSVEGSLQIRYGFWNHLGYLTRAAREFTALTYYKVKGWI